MGDNIMIRLATIIEQFEADFLSSYRRHILPSQLKALGAIKNCRTQSSPLMRLNCSDCDNQTFIPHSCGYRSCPHCQHHESQQWIERQVQKQLPASYFMITFTLPAELRPLAFHHQKVVYSALFDCAWATLKEFSLNDQALQGSAGVVAVLHTHSRALNHHPHIHAVMPAASIQKKQRLWRKKEGAYLFNHKALAKVFRAKLLAALVAQGLSLPAHYPKKWIVDCKAVGSGDKALTYLGRYLYRGVINEKDILSCERGLVTFRYRDSKTKRYKTRTLPGAQFLQLVLQHVLPKGFRRARSYGFLHPNSKSLIKLIHLLFKYDPQKWRAKEKPRPQIKCQCCGAVMIIVETRIKQPKVRFMPRNGLERTKDHAVF